MINDKFCIEGVTGVKHVIRHKINLKFTLGKQEFTHIFYVLNSFDIQFILGADFLSNMEYY